MRILMTFVSRLFTGLRYRLMLLVILVAAPLVTTTLRTAWDSRQHQMRNWRSRAERMMQLSNREEEKVVGETRQLLLAVAESSPVRSADSPRCRTYLAELLASYRRYANFGVLTTNGEVVASAAPIIGGVNLTDRGFLHRVLESRTFAVSDFPAAPPKGKPGVDFGCPVFDADGAVKAVVFASLDLTWANRFDSELPAQLPRGATWSEIDYRGRILTRYPSPERWFGEPLPERSLLGLVFDGEDGVIEAPDPKGVINVYAFSERRSQLVSGETVTILGIPKQTLYAEADRAAIRELTWLGVGVGIALLLGWLGSNMLVLRPVKALVVSSGRLASGDLTARTGLPHGKDELGRLTLTFDLMAENLEQRESDRKRAAQNLQALSHRLVEVQEAERRQIARELHDEIGQTLTTAEMNLQTALRAPPAVSVKRCVKESIEAVERVLEQVRDLSLSLRPSMLDDLGLEPALRWYTQRQARLSGLKARFRADPLENRVDSLIETECFRVAQEALTNVVRHAHATNVSVELKRRNGDLYLSVRDDGVGFDVAGCRDQAVRGASLGLLSMEERAHLVGGNLEFVSAPGQGTEVRAWFPIRWRLPQT